MDEVIGIALLQTDVSPQRLYCVYKAEGKEPSLTTIAVHEEGSQKLTDPSWAYRKDGEMLHMTPSLHIGYRWPDDKGEWRTLFHNGFNWSVKYKLAEPGSGYRQLKEANGIPVQDYD